MARHQIDAPDQLSGDIAPDRPDRSDLSFFYPEVSTESRPLIHSQAERYRQYDQRRQADRSRLHRAVFRLTGLFTIPLIALTIIALVGLPLIGNNPMAGVFFTVLALMAWLYTSRWAYERFLDICNTHDVSGGTILLACFVTAPVTAGLTWWLLNTSTFSLWSSVGIISIVELIIIALTLKILISLATRSWRAARQND